MDVLENATGERLLDEGHDGLCVGDVAVVRVADLDDESESLAELVLEMLYAAETLELAVDHDGETRAQRLAFLHAGTRANEGHASNNRNGSGRKNL